MSVPVTVVHGWLDGAGDRLAAQLADLGGPGTALLHGRGFDQPLSGDVEVLRIKEQVAYRAPGCSCCTVRVDLVDDLGRLLRRRQRPDRVIVAEVPGADPATSVVSLLSDPALRDDCHLDGVLVGLDGPALATAIAERVDDPWAAASVLDATILADHVWIAGGRALTHRGVLLAASAARSVNPLATVDSATPTDGRLLRLDAWSPTRLPARLRQLARAAHPSARGGGAVHTGTVSLVVDGLLDGDRLEDWVHELHGTAGTRLLRIEGELAIAGEEHRQLVVGCRTTVRTSDGAAWGDDLPCSRLRLAVRHLELGDLDEQLLDCRA